MKKFILAFTAILSIGMAAAYANYTMTQGAGTTFGSVIVGGFHYVQMFVCDLTTPAQCQSVSAAGEAKVAANPGTTVSTGTGWTSATGLNTTQAIMSSGGWPAISVQLNQTSTISGGAVTFEGTYDGTNWVSIPVAQILNPNTFAALTNPYTLVASTNQPFLILTQGYQQVRLKLSTVITGSATVTPQIALLPTNPTIGALLNPISAGSSIIGKVGIDQTTPNVTNHVSTGPYPDSAVPYTATATGTTGATTATLAGASSVTTYICGFSIRANATAAATGNATVTGVITATLNYTQWTAPNASGLGVTEMIFAPCIPASATNTSIAVVSAAPGTGGVVSVTAWGYKL